MGTTEHKVKENFALAGAKISHAVVLVVSEISDYARAEGHVSVDAWATETVLASARPLPDRASS